MIRDREEEEEEEECSLLNLSIGLFDLFIIIFFIWIFSSLIRDAFSADEEYQQMIRQEERSKEQIFDLQQEIIFKEHEIRKLEDQLEEKNKRINDILYSNSVLGEN